jgi:hypothetical protein
MIKKLFILHIELNFRIIKKKISKIDFQKRF